MGFTVHMRVHVSMEMGLIYESFMTISTKTFLFSLVLSNHMSSQGVPQSKEHRSLIVFIFVLIQDMPLKIAFFCKSFIAVVIFECGVAMYNTLVVFLAKLLSPESSAFVRLSTIACLVTCVTFHC